MFHITLDGRRRSRGVVCVLSFMWIAGCAGQNSRASLACTSLECINQGLVKTVSRQCREDLNDHHMMSHAQRERINATYAYPLTNERTYTYVMRTGGLGPSPESWCRNYARWRVGLTG